MILDLEKQEGGGGGGERDGTSWYFSVRNKHQGHSIRTILNINIANYKNHGDEFVMEA